MIPFRGGGNEAESLQICGKGGASTERNREACTDWNQYMAFVGGNNDKEDRHLHPSCAADPVRYGGFRADQALAETDRHRLDAAGHHGRVQDRHGFLREGRGQGRERHGFNVQVITQSPATHTAFADQVAIIEDFIQREVDVIAISPIEVEVIKPAIAEGQREGHPGHHRQPVGADCRRGGGSYIGFDNTVGGRSDRLCAARLLRRAGRAGHRDEGRGEPQTSTWTWRSGEKLYKI